jgi:hypothetical protein
VTLHEDIGIVKLYDESEVPTSRSGRMNHRDLKETKLLPKKGEKDKFHEQQTVV